MTDTQQIVKDLFKDEKGEVNGLQMMFDRLYGKVPITTENLNVQSLE